jgi:hypothetical protein
MNYDTMLSEHLREFQEEQKEREASESAYESSHCAECGASPDVECCMEGRYLCRECLDMSECMHCGYKHCPVKHEAKFDL